MPWRKVLALIALASFWMHGLFHVWKDYMAIPDSKNPFAFLFSGSLGSFWMHPLEWALISAAILLIVLDDKP
jgi:hypothetical protein